MLLEEATRLIQGSLVQFGSHEIRGIPESFGGLLHQYFQRRSPRWILHGNLGRIQLKCVTHRLVYNRLEPTTVWGLLCDLG
jgi:hypothetical protein